MPGRNLCCVLVCVTLLSLLLLNAKFLCDAGTVGRPSCDPSIYACFIIWLLMFVSSCYRSSYVSNGSQCGTLVKDELWTYDCQQVTAKLQVFCTFLHQLWLDRFKGS
jgi:hypothetical protein